ncbi:MAG: DUF1015 family protein [Myxococcaceae bacterium]|nr:DUF1015 family protein [Myxococcaceae bacterium]
MAHVLPFRALRFPSPEEGAERIEAPELRNAPDPWATLQRWANAGELVSEPPALYVVEVRDADPYSRRPPVHLLVGAMHAGEEGLDALERAPARPARAPVQPVPVLAADDHGVLRALLAEIAAEGIAVWEAQNGPWRWRMWRVPGGALTRRLRTVLEEIPVRPHGPLPEDGTFLAAVVPLSEPGLKLAPYHRGLKGLHNFTPERFLALVRDYARIYELEGALMTRAGLDAARERLATISRGQHGVLLILPGGQGKLLRFRQGMELDHIPAAPRSPTLRSLDLALLNALVLRTVLGIPDPEAPGHPNVYAVTELEDLVAQVDAGVFQVGFGLNPPPVWELRAVIEAAQSLPPKTVRVDPVPPLGLLFLDPSTQRRG